MSNRKVITYQGTAATVTWDRDLCIHFGECGRARNELFVTGRDPWCAPDEVDDDTVREVVARCPSGALAATFTDPDRAEGTIGENTVTVAYNGPLFFRGALDIENAPAEAPALEHRAALCRCGLSKHKPYCDNSHLDGGWHDAGSVGDTGADSIEPGGPLTVQITKSGPLKVAGNFSIVAASGRVAWRGERTALCRCGMSNNKPFCDGSHRKEGWSDEA